MTSEWEPIPDDVFRLGLARNLRRWRDALDLLARDPERDDDEDEPRP